MAILLRAFVAWLLTLSWTLLVAVGALALAFGNFTVAWQSFIAQGFEQLPLRQVPLLGPIAEGLGFGDAPLAALYAFVLTLAMNLAIMATAKALARALRFYFDRRQLLRSNDEADRASAHDYRDRTVEVSVWLAGLLIASVLIIGYDVAQFRFRYEDLFAQLGDPQDTLDWAPDAVARLGEFLAGFIRSATWGYIGCIIAMAIALEYAIVRAGETWHALHNAVAQAAAPVRAAVQDQQIPATAQQPALIPGETAPAQFAGIDTATATTIGNAAPQPQPTTASSEPEPIPPPPHAEPPPTVAAHDGGQTIEVIIGPGRMQTFSQTEVLQDADRFVRDGSGRAWFLREYWEQLMGNNGHLGATP